MATIEGHKNLSHPTPYLNRSEVVVSIFFALSIGLSLTIYWPGLSGSLILDDFVNLTALGQISDITNTPEVLFFLGKNSSSNLGRPISMLSFALQHYHFPVAWWFKYVNVMIHLLNGCLLFIFLLLAAKLSGILTGRVKLVALLTTTLWLIHPLHVSTVQYVIQRMTELSALFTLAGIVSYCIGRKYLVQSKTLIGYIWVSSGVVFGGILATLSKENGVLLPLYLLVLEFVLFKKLPQPRYWKAWSTSFLVAPLIIVVVYFSLNINSLVLNPYSSRDFTLTERLLTESRVLSDYLTKIFITLPHSFGIFHDNYTISHGLLDPISTSIAIFAVTALITSAFYFVKRAPVYSFAIMWFFLGHILESTIIPLELYFEHRNYLPIVGILFSLVTYGLKFYDRLSTRMVKAIFAFFGIFYMSVLSAVTYSENVLWGDVYKQSYIWAAENQDSLRAQLRFGTVLSASKDYAQAANFYNKLNQNFPNNALIYIKWLSLSCHDATITLPNMKDINKKLSKVKFDANTLNSLNRIVSLKEKGKCKNIPYVQLTNILQTLSDNPEFKAKEYYVYYLLGKLHASQRLLNPAMLSLDKAFSLHNAPEIPLLQTEWLVSAELYEDAKIYLEKARQSAARRPVLNLALRKQFQWWEEVIAQLETKRSNP